TATVRKWLHCERATVCKETTKAKGTAYGTGVVSESDTSPAKHAAPPATAHSQPLVASLPQFLPLAFHQACSHADCEEVGAETSFAAKNVVLLMEEVHAAVHSIVTKLNPAV